MIPERVDDFREALPARQLSLLSRLSQRMSLGISDALHRLGFVGRLSSTAAADDGEGEGTFNIERHFSSCARSRVVCLPLKIGDVTMDTALLSSNLTPLQLRKPFAGSLRDP
jgi:hypothetical protein